MKTFEKFLRDEIWQPEGVLDDDMPDAFDTWCAELDIQEVMDYAEDFGKLQFIRGKTAMKDKEPIGTDCQCDLGSEKHYHPDCEYLKEEECHTKMEKKEEYKIVMYAIADKGEGMAMEIGRYDSIEEIPPIRCWLFNENTEISLEYQKDEKML